VLEAAIEDVQRQQRPVAKHVEGPLVRIGHHRNARVLDKRFITTETGVFTADEPTGQQPITPDEFVHDSVGEQGLEPGTSDVGERSENMAGMVQDPAIGILERSRLEIRARVVRQRPSFWTAAPARPRAF
jgi:hypothetical protein